MKEILEKKENEFKETEIKYMMELDKATDEVLKMKKQAKDLEEIKAQKSTTSDHNYYHDEPLQKKPKFSIDETKTIVKHMPKCYLEKFLTVSLLYKIVVDQA